MKQTILGVLMSVAMSGAIVAAQDGSVPSPGASPSPPPAQSQPAPRDPATRGQTSSTTESTVTGCLVQGSGPTVFLLQDAKVSAAAPSPGAAAAARPQASASMDRGTTYRLESETGARGVDFKAYLNRQVSITGKIDAKAEMIAMPSDDKMQKVDEKTLGKLTATSLTKLADTCSAIG